MKFKLISLCYHTNAEPGISNFSTISVLFSLSNIKEGILNLILPIIKKSHGETDQQKATIIFFKLSVSEFLIHTV